MYVLYKSVFTLEACSVRLNWQAATEEKGGVFRLE